MIDLCYLKPGALIKIRFGQDGHQIGIVTKEPVAGRALKVRKWRANSKRWTQPLKVFRSEVLVGLPASAMTEDMDKALAKVVGDLVPCDDCVGIGKIRREGDTPAADTWDICATCNGNGEAR